MGVSTVTNDVLLVGFGYNLKNPEGNLSITPELLLGRSVSKANLNNKSIEVNPDYLAGGAGHEYELERIVVASVRINLHPTDKFSVFVRPSYSSAHYAFNAPDAKFEDNTNWEFGLGLGAGYNIDHDVTVSASYDRIGSDADAVAVSLQYRF
jgi:opacity protein-like surface antigen